MKKLIFFLLFLTHSYTVISGNIGSQQNTWYKINSKGTFLTKIKASGHYAQHEVVVDLTNNYWNTAEVQYISEFNYNHNRIKLEWGYVGSGANIFLAVRIVPVIADYASSFEFIDIMNPSFDYGLVAVDASLVTVIQPKANLFVDEWTGNVGIGTTYPSSKLEVKGGDFIMRAITNDVGDIVFQTNNSTQLGRVWSNGVNNESGLYLSSGDNNPDITISSTGHVGVGTLAPDEKLSVNGNIHTKEVRVDLIGWSDFVFAKDYNLPTLQEVEQHIKEKGHLKDIPSAKEVDKNGILLGDMNAKLLQKIEELMLYTIEQEKKLQTQEIQLKLQNEISQSLQFRLLKLEELLTKK